jgi:hypothetical protein
LGVHGVAQVLQLGDEFGVDLEAAAGVVEDDVVVVFAGEAQGPAAEIGHAFAGLRLHDPRADLPRQRLELVHGGGPADVAGDEQDLLALLLPLAGQLAASRRLAGAVRAQQHHFRGNRGEIEILCWPPSRATSSSWKALTICWPGATPASRRAEALGLDAS